MNDSQQNGEIINMIGEFPPCYRSMKAHMVDYDPQRGLTIAMPVEENYLNPAGSMQGGIISAAFDNVFGYLCVLASGTANSAALNITTNYHRPIFQGDEITITARVKYRGKTTIHMTAEGYNRQGKLIATSSSTYMIKKVSA